MPWVLMTWGDGESLHLSWARNTVSEEGSFGCTGSVGSLRLFLLLKCVALPLQLTCTPHQRLIYGVSRAASSETPRCLRWAQQSALLCISRWWKPWRCCTPLTCPHWASRDMAEDQGTAEDRYSSLNVTLFCPIFWKKIYLICKLKC